MFLCLSIEPSDNFLEFFCRPAAGVVQQHNVTSHISIASRFTEAQFEISVLLEVLINFFGVEIASL